MHQEEETCPPASAPALQVSCLRDAQRLEESSGTSAITISAARWCAK